MSKRMYALSSPNRRLVSDLASSVLPTPVGPAQEGDPTWTTAAAWGADAGHRSLDDVEQVGDGMILSFDTVAQERAAVAHASAVEPCPRVLRHADLVAPHGVAHLRQPELLAARQFRHAVRSASSMPSVLSTKALMASAIDSGGAPRKPSMPRSN